MTDYPYTLFQITRNGKNFELKPHSVRGVLIAFLSNEVIPEKVARELTLRLLDNCTEDHSPTGEMPRSEDFLENLEVEMANDSVTENVKTQRSLQDMTATRILAGIFNDGECVADATEVENLAFWLNRQLHRVPHLDVPTRYKKVLRTSCHTTSAALLAASMAA